MLPRGLAVGLAVLISVVWAANVVIGFVEPDRRDPTINGFFAVVVGAIFALGGKDAPAVRRVRQQLARIIGGPPTDKDQP